MPKAKPKLNPDLHPRLYYLLEIDTKTLDIKQASNIISFCLIKLATTPRPAESDKRFFDRILFEHATTVLANLKTQEAYHDYIRKFQEVKDTCHMDIYQLFIDDIRNGRTEDAKFLLEEIIVKIPDNGLFKRRLKDAKLLSDFNSKYSDMYKLISDAQCDSKTKSRLLSCLHLSFFGGQINEKSSLALLQGNLPAPAVAAGKSSPRKTNPNLNPNVAPLNSNLTSFRLASDSPIHLSKRARLTNFDGHGDAKKTKLTLPVEIPENDENKYAGILMDLKNLPPANKL